MFLSIVIGQVTGVSVLCEAVDTMNRCNVTWDVSNCLCVCMYIYQPILSIVVNAARNSKETKKHILIYSILLVYCSMLAVFLPKVL